jgi:hypothetical protein
MSGILGIAVRKTTSIAIDAKTLLEKSMRDGMICVDRHPYRHCLLLAGIDLHSIDAKIHIIEGSKIDEEKCSIEGWMTEIREILVYRRRLHHILYPWSLHRNHRQQYTRHHPCPQIPRALHPCRDHSNKPMTTRNTSNIKTSNNMLEVSRGLCPA